MKSIGILISVLLSCSFVFASVGNNSIQVSENIELIQISPTAYVHVSVSDSKWGRVSSNGFLLVKNGKAFLFDTPMEETSTKLLVKYIEDSLHAVITGFVPNHWHDDCVGGLAYLHSKGIPSYANSLTGELCKKVGLQVPKHLFTDSLTLELEGIAIHCYFPGAAHTLDNIVVYIPQDKILFAGCMAKELKSQTMGNITDGDIKAWPSTIKKVMDQFPDTRIVIPGHGKFGGFELLHHTLELARTNNK